MHYESITIPSLQRRGAVLPLSVLLAETYFRQTFLSNYTSQPLDIWYVASIRDPSLHLLNSDQPDIYFLFTDFGPKKIFVCLRLPDRPYFNSLPFNILFHLLKIKKIQRSPTNPFLIQSCCQMTVLIAVVERYASVWTDDTLN